LAAGFVEPLVAAVATEIPTANGTTASAVPTRQIRRFTRYLQIFLVSNNPPLQSDPPAN
jgi:hypothetical protein